MKKPILILLACSSVLLAGCGTYTQSYTSASCSNEEAFIVSGHIQYIHGDNVVISGNIGYSCACDISDGGSCDCPYYNTGLYQFKAKNCDVVTSSPEALIDFNERKLRY